MGKPVLSISLFILLTSEVRTLWIPRLPIPQAVQTVRAHCTRDKTLISSQLPQCCVGIEDFIHGRSAPGNLDRPNNAFIPPWLNLPLARKGQEVVMEYWYPFLFSMLYGLLFELNMPDVRDVLLFSGKSSTHAMNAKRDMATLAQALVWFGDTWVTSPAENPLSNFITSVAAVRARHIGAAMGANYTLRTKGYIYDPSRFDSTQIDDGLWNAFHSDLDASSIPESQRVIPPSHRTNLNNTVVFNQQAMGFVFYNLLAYPMMFPKELGIAASDEELWAMNHLFAVFGYALGMEDQYNIALQPDLDSARGFYKQIFERYIIPGLFHVEKRTYILMETVFGGIGAVTQGLMTPRLILHRFLKQLIKIEPLSIFASMTAKEKATEESLNTALNYELMKEPLHRAALNNVAKTMIYATGKVQFPGQFTDFYSLAKYCHA